MEWTSNGSESNLEGGLVRGGRSVAAGENSGDGVTSGLVNHWTFDDTGATTTVLDSGGTSNGTYSGEATVVSGATAKIGTSLNFDGTDDRVTMGPYAGSDNIFVGGGTISLWFYMDAAGATTASNIIDKKSIGGSFQGWDIVPGTTAGTFTFRRDWTSNDGVWTFTGAYNADEWVHMVFMYDDDSTANDPVLYVNNSLVATPAPSGVPSGVAEDDSVHDIIFGGNDDGTSDFDGMIDDARLYNRTLTVQEIADIYNAGQSGVDISGSGFPQVESVTETSFPSNTTTHNVSMPATVNSGELLIAHLTFDDSASVSSTPSGWTLIDANRLNLYMKVADGTEGGTTVDFPTAAIQAGAAQVHRISDWYGDLSGVEHAATTVEGDGTLLDPPEVTATWGRANNLWLVLAGWLDDD